MKLGNDNISFYLFIEKSSWKTSNKKVSEMTSWYHLQYKAFPIASKN